MVTTKRTRYTRRLALALFYQLLLLITSSSALQPTCPTHVGRGVPFSTIPRKYRVLDADEESARRRIRMPRFPWRRPKTKRESQDANSEILRDSENPVLATEATEPTHEEEQTKPTEQPRVITNVHELRTAILDDGMELREVENAAVEADVNVKEMLNHDVVELLAKRFKEGSVPGLRSKDDTAKLALSIEGGGMRGAVSAGMASAVACLGLCDSFDAIYGASAGSIIGAYMVSRQMCVDVYTQVLPAAKSQFVCKKRLVTSLAINAMEVLFRKLPIKWRKSNPGMNISFILDGVMDQDQGLRPFDAESFEINNAKQPLRVASSGVQAGKLESLCFGSENFSNKTEPSRDGLFRCLEASMTVPGATGPPVPVWHDGSLKACFDAFCFEPIPYRSAVAEGATHVLVLRTRPEGFVAKTKPGVYEKAVTPLYFNTHGQPEVSEFFEKGGQQYIYLEDLLTLEEGRHVKEEGGIHIPPADVLYGVQQDDRVREMRSNRHLWKKAHVLPITVPKGTPELSTIEMGGTEVLEAVRQGFAVAFDLLAPAVGLELDDMTGERVAQLVFPPVSSTKEEVLENPLNVRGNFIQATTRSKATATSANRRPKRRRLSASGVLGFVSKRMKVRSLFSGQKQDDTVGSIARAGGGLSSADNTPDVAAKATLLEHLPGIQPDQIPHLARGLQQT